MDYEDRWWWAKFITKMILFLVAFAIIGAINYYATCNYAPRIEW